MAVSKEGVSAMAETIKIVCAGCGMKVDTPRCDTDPPGAVELRGIKCGDCDDGGFDMPEFFGVDGNVISGDPETFRAPE